MSAHFARSRTATKPCAPDRVSGGKSRALYGGEVSGGDSGCGGIECYLQQQ